MTQGANSAKAATKDLQNILNERLTRESLIIIQLAIKEGELMLITSQAPKKVDSQEVTLYRKRGQATE